MPPILDVAIGLVFVYLLFSLVVTAAHEVCAAFTTSTRDKRAQMLKEGIGELLCDSNAPGGISEQFFGHPLITALSPKGSDSMPNYVPRETFVSTVLDLIAKPNPFRGRTADDIVSGILGSVEALFAERAKAALAELSKKYPASADLQACFAAFDSVVTDPAKRAAFTTALTKVQAVVASDIGTAQQALTNAKALAAGPARDQAVATAQAAYDALEAHRTRIEAVQALLPQLASPGTAIKNLINPELQKTLLSLYEDAGHDVDAFKKQLGAWFDRSMDRVTGWYKKYAQGFTLILGLVLAITCNVDSLRIVDTLSTDPNLRQQIVNSATDYVKDHPTASGDTIQIKDAVRQMNGFGLPVGWREGDWGKVSHDFPSFLTALMGWLLTAIAASLGAPFWFDTLNKIVTIRAGGRAPEEKNPGEKAADGQKKDSAKKA